MRVRILCGAYVPSSPFIEGGCMYEWLESLEEPCDVSCPSCGTICGAWLVASAISTLLSHVVLAVGCPHHAFTFSRRRKEPYFSSIEAAGEAQEAADDPDEAAGS